VTARSALPLAAVIGEPICHVR